MSTDLLRVQANERVDFDDFLFIGQRALEDNTRQVVTSLLCRPGAQQAWILSGFAMSNPSGNLLQVARGVAVLPRRDGARIVEGILTTEGEAQKTLDLGSYSAEAHGIYIQFTYQEAEIESRLFWNPNSETEYAQSVPTRMQAAWDARVERVNPGSEWFKIGEINPSTMVITDQRDFYFEGKVDDTYTADRWGTGTDRNADRAQYGIGDLQRFTEAFRVTVEELKSSSGNRRWWEAGIRDLVVDTGPLRVGFSGGTAPGDDSLLVGDVFFGMVGGAAPYLRFDTGDQWGFDRASNTWQWLLGATPLMEFGPSTGLWVYDSAFSFWVYGVSPRVTFDATDWLQYDRTANAWTWRIGGGVVATQDATGLSVAGGLQVGFAGTPIADTLQIGDTSTWMSNVGSIGLRIQFDSDDYLDLLRGSPEIVRLVLDGATQWETQTSIGTGFTFGLRVGAAGMPAATNLEVGDADFYLQNIGGNPRIYFDTNDFMLFSRIDNAWQFYVGGALSAGLSAGLLLLEGDANIKKGLAIGYTNNSPVDGVLSIGDANNAMQQSGSDPLWTVDTTDTLTYIRSSNQWEWAIGGNVQAELTTSAGRGSLGLRDSVATVQHLDGNDFQTLKGLANAGLVQSSFLLRGGNLWYASGAPNNVASIGGLAYMYGQVVNTENVIFQIDTASRWLAGAFPWTYLVTVAEAWVFAYVNNDGLVRLSLFCPDSAGCLSAAAEAAFEVEGGKTRYDYCYIGSLYYVNNDGSSLSGIMPFARQGDIVWFQPHESSFHTETSAAAGFSAITKSGVLPTFPADTNFPYTPATGIMCKVRQDLDPAVGSSFASHIQFSHGSLNSDGPIPTVFDAAEFAHNIYSTDPAYWYEGPFPLMMRRTSGTNWTLGGLRRNVISDGTRTITLYGVGYIEPLNGIKHVQTGL